MMKNRGYVLLEAVICIGLLSIIFLCVSMMTFNFSNLTSKMVNAQDKLERARLGHYFLCEQIRRADKIKIYVTNQAQLKKIDTYLSKNDSKSNHAFEFKKNQLKFGGRSNKGEWVTNELCDKISHIDIKFENDLLYVKIVPEDFLPTNFILNLKNKIVELKQIK